MSSALLKILPVKFIGTRSKKIIYALLDEDSSVTIINEEKILYPKYYILNGATCDMIRHLHYDIFNIDKMLVNGVESEFDSFAERMSFV